MEAHGDRTVYPPWVTRLNLFTDSPLVHIAGYLAFLTIVVGRFEVYALGMTHPELLIEINRRLNVALYNGDPQAIHALREIAELHTYVLTGKKMRGKAGLSKRCTECGFAYPCSTIQIIERGLA